MRTTHWRPTVPDGRSRLRQSSERACAEAKEILLWPQRRGIENHIRQEIREAVREDMIEPDDARDLMNQLQQIRYQEQREFQVHGWRLPDDDRERIRDQLARLDHVVDETRNEQ